MCFNKIKSDFMTYGYKDSKSNSSDFGGILWIINEISEFLQNSLDFRGISRDFQGIP
jgi:hypothetical protein